LNVLFKTPFDKSDTTMLNKPLMIKIDPIIAVKDVEASSKWYQSVLGCRSMHGGKEFDILISENDEVLLCLHKWGEHGHPTNLSSK
jgi:catechol-2,3-dioxygenase